MNPVVIIGIVQFVWALAKPKPPNVDSLLISNQIKILQGLTIIAEDLQLVQTRLVELEKLVLNLPANVEIYETTAEIRTAISAINDVYKILEKRIKENSKIDFTSLISDLKSEYEKSIGLLTHAESIMADDNSHNALVYAIITFDAILFTLSTHLIYPDLLYNNIRSRTEKVENPIFDSQIDVDTFEVQYVARLVRIYADADIVLRRHINNIFHEVLPMASATGGDPKHSLDFSSSSADFDQIQDNLVDEFRRYAVRIEKQPYNTFALSSNFTLQHDLILEVVRPYDLSDLGEGTFRFITLYRHFGVAHVNTDGTHADPLLFKYMSNYSVDVGRKENVPDVLKKLGITLINPTYERIVGQASSPKKVPGVQEKLIEYSFAKKVPPAYQAERDKILQNSDAIFYKSTLRHMIQNRSEFMSSLRHSRATIALIDSNRLQEFDVHRSSILSLLKSIYDGYELVSKYFEVKNTVNENAFKDLLHASTTEYLDEKHPDFINLRQGHVTSVVFQAVMFVNVEEIFIDELGNPYHEKKLKVRYVGAGTSVDSAVYLKMIDDDGFFDESMWDDLSGEYGNDVEILNQAFIEVKQEDLSEEFGVSVELDHETPIQKAKKKIDLQEKIAKVPSMEGRMHALTRARREYESSILSAISTKEKVEMLKLIGNKEILLGNLGSAVASYEKFRKELAAAQGSAMVDYLLSAASMVANAVEVAEQKMKSEEMKQSYQSLGSQLGNIQNKVQLLDTSIGEINKKIEELGKTPPPINNFKIILYKGPSLHEGVIEPLT